MKHSLSLLLLTFCLSCTTPEPEQALVRVSDCPDFLIDRVQHTSGNRTQTSIYTYDAEDRIIAIDEPQNKLRTEWQYDEGLRPTKKEVFSLSGRSEELIRESFYFYDGNNRLIKTQDDWEEVFYEYDEWGQLFKSYGRRTGTSEKFLRANFFWEEGHIHKIEGIDENGELILEQFFTFDSECNPFYNSPLAVENLILQDPNNLIFSRLVDYTGLIDMLCTECTTTYEFNANGLPTRISTTRGFTQEIIYK